jgi:hypothetical protein
MPKPKRPESTEARRFAMILAVLLTVIAALSWWKHHATRATLLVSIAAAALLLTHLLPRLWVRLFRVWMKLALAISWVMTRVLLSVLYYGFITPYGLLGRLLRRDPLDLSWKRRRPSYWIDKTDTPGGVGRYEKPF